MVAQGNFIFKGIFHKDGGEFNNGTQVVKYPESYQLKFDEIVDGVPTERTTKIDVKNVELIKKCEACKTYSRVSLIFDVAFIKTGVVVRLTDIAAVEKQ